MAERAIEKERKTMGEYIDREAMLEQIERRERMVSGDKTISVDALKQFVLNRPAADVAPIIHAKWKYGKCTHCGAEIPTENKHYLIESNKCKYCYSCGAIMDER